MPLHNEPVEPRKRRKLNYSKCSCCRQDKKRCEPADRRWPAEKCTRCLEEDLPCSEPQLRKAGGLHQSSTGLQNGVSASGGIDLLNDQAIHNQQDSSKTWYEVQLAEKDALIAARDATISALEGELRDCRAMDQALTEDFSNNLEEVRQDEKRLSQRCDIMFKRMCKRGPSFCERNLNRLSTISIQTGYDYLERMVLTALNSELLPPEKAHSHTDYLFWIQTISPTLRVKISLSSWEVWLIMASKAGHVKAVERISRRMGVDVNMRDNEGRTALWYAVKQGHVDVVEELLQCPNIDPNLACPLASAVDLGNQSIVKCLIECQKIEVDRPDENGHRPLVRAIMNDSWLMVRELNRFVGRIGWSVTVQVWKAAASRGHPRVISELLSLDFKVHEIELHDTASAVARKHGHHDCALLLESLETIARKLYQNSWAIAGLTSMAIRASSLGMVERQSWNDAIVRYRLMNDT